MPKTFPILLEVEEIALGTVLRKLNDMPGIAKLDLNLGHGGQGAGRKKLEEHSAEAKPTNGDRAQSVVKLLMSGPKHISEISKLVGGNKARAYGIMNKLRLDGVTETDGHGTHKLTKKAHTKLNGSNGSAIHAPDAPAVAALPAPSRGKAGRLSPGTGPKILRAALANGGLTTAMLGKHMVENGLTGKSLSGILLRAKRDGLIRKEGGSYVLTPKGQKIELGA